jgi:serine phosphatase RsbU (regulator of sigma subunit)
LSLQDTNIPVSPEARQLHLLRERLESISVASEILRVMMATDSLDAAVAILLSGLADSVACRSLALFEATADSLVEIGREGGGGSPEKASISFERTDHPAIACLRAGRHRIEDHLSPWWSTGDIAPGPAILLPFEGRLGADPSQGSLASHLLWIDAPRPLPLPSSLMDFLVSLTGQGGVLLSGLRFRDDLRRTYEALRTANHKLQKDIDRAKRIQEGLIPRATLEAPGIRAASRYQPAEKVSGDSFDIFPIDADQPEGAQALLVADVSGHGISAAMVMSMFKVLLRRSLKHTANPDQALLEVNRELLDQVRGLHFVTVFLGIFSPADRRLRWVSAGHCPQILLRRDGTLVSFEASGLFIGAFDAPDLSCDETLIEPGDRMLLHTDGITEAADPDGEMFGFERVVENLRTHAASSPEASLDHLHAALKAFVQGEPIEDDLTLLLAEFS